MVGVEKAVVSMKHVCSNKCSLVLAEFHEDHKSVIVEAYLATLRFRDVTGFKTAKLVCLPEVVVSGMSLLTVPLPQQQQHSDKSTQSLCVLTYLCSSVLHMMLLSCWMYWSL